jgi:hypothetical protein
LHPAPPLASPGRKITGISKDVFTGVNRENRAFVPFVSFCEIPQFFSPEAAQEAEAPKVGSGQFRLCALSVLLEIFWPVHC